MKRIKILLLLETNLDWKELVAEAVGLQGRLEEISQLDSSTRVVRADIYEAYQTSRRVQNKNGCGKAKGPLDLRFYQDGKL